MTEYRALSLVEIDVPPFASSSPDLPLTTMRFAVDTEALLDVPYVMSVSPQPIPSIKSIAMQPAGVSLGENLGQRATVTVTFNDHKHVMASESFNSGTFWGKFRARYGLRLRGKPMRVKFGFAPQLPSAMETRYFIIDSTDGPNGDGEFKIIAKDILKQLDGDRAVAPTLSNGSLVADITNVATSATLTPAGIGNAEYPASGFASIGGNEACSFTRAGDVLTLTRAQLNTLGQAHTAGDRVQVLLRYVGADVADIIRDLMVTYSGVPSAYIDLTAWKAETSGFLGVVYTATISEPTSVNKLVAELVEQAALAIWWDDLNQQIRLQVLRPIATTATTFDQRSIIADSIDVSEQPDKRVSRIYTYFGKINPLLNEDQIENYRSSVLTADSFAEAAYGSQAIKTIYSRWIPAGGRSIAQRLNDIQLGRFVDPPRALKFSLFRYSGDTAPALGGGYQIGATMFQDQNGLPALVPVQLTRLNTRDELYECEAEEMLFTTYSTVSPNTHTIIFDADENDVNLRTRHDSLYPTPTAATIVNAYVNAGIVVGSTSKDTPALDIGSWPVGTSVNLFVNGRIEGRGGTGGNGGVTSFTPAAPAQAGSKGGTALKLARAITMTTTSGAIWGGGGGGGGAGSHTDGASFGIGGGGGGGGAGRLGGIGGAAGFGTTNTPTNGSAGTDTTGGVGGNLSGKGGSSFNGGLGGGPGLAGAAGQPSASQPGAGGGAAGNSIDGVGFVTVSGAPGDIRGPQI